MNLGHSMYFLISVCAAVVVAYTFNKYKQMKTIEMITSKAGSIIEIVSSNSNLKDSTAFILLKSIGCKVTPFSLPEGYVSKLVFELVLSITSGVSITKRNMPKGWVYDLMPMASETGKKFLKKHSSDNVTITVYHAIQWLEIESELLSEKKRTTFKTDGNFLHMDFLK